MADLSRDEPFDRLLKRRLASEGTGGGVCPDAELLAALAEGRLSGPELRTVERHAAACARCTHIVALTAATETNARVDGPRPVRFGAWRWAVPLATAATVAGLWVVTRTNAPGVSIIPVPPAATRQTQDQAVSSPEALPSAGARASSPATQEAPMTETARGAEPRNVERRRADTSESRADASLSAAAAPPAAEGARSLEEKAALAAPIAVDARFAAPAIRVASPDPKIVWQVRGGAIERSIDSGTTWTIEYTADRRVLTGLSVSADVAWMGGERGLVLRRSTMGWSVAAAPAAADVVAIEAASASAATVRLVDGRSFLTADSGATWALR